MMHCPHSLSPLARKEELQKRPREAEASRQTQADQPGNKRVTTHTYTHSFTHTQLVTHSCMSCTIILCASALLFHRTKTRSSKEATDQDDVQQAAKEPENVTGGDGISSSEAANGEGDRQQVAESGSSLQASSETPMTPLETNQSACNAASDPLEPPSSPRPPSPSRYMRRLPPPPGFYLPREHSYAQLCPLVWRKRYDRAIDNLEKALRLLSAARRRENRLRHALTRLQESRLKSTLSRLRDVGSRGKDGRGGGTRGRPPSWSTQRSGGEGAGGGGGVGETHRPERGASLGSTEDSEAEGATEDVEVRGEEAGGWRGQGRARGGGEREEDDGGCCFYCGRGRNDEEASRDRVLRTTGMDERDSEVSRRRQVAKRGRGRKPVETRNDREVRDTPKECYLYYYQTSEREEDGQVITLGLPQPQRDMAMEACTDIHSHPLQPLSVVHQQADSGCVQLHSLTGTAFPTTVTLQDSASTPAIQLLTSGSSLPQGLMLTDLVPNEGTTMVEGQQEYWVQHAADGSMVLLPVSSPEDGGTVTIRGLTEEMETRAIFVSDVGFHSSQAEDREGIRVESDAVSLRVSGPSDKQGGLQSNVKGVVLSGDVKEKLKEHLEGFQLQLSNEFND